MLQSSSAGPRCNIGPQEIDRRRRIAIAVTLFTAALAAWLVALGAPASLRLVVFPFAAGGAVTWLQVVRRFCVRFGFGGLENFGLLGEERRVAATQLAADRRRAAQLVLEGLLIGLVVTLAVVAIRV
ncbi:MAG TPA: hypothetical protein VFW86_00985 [Candidatus Limnocylindrales bacterium]|nr:hypothetical protein [Candidatus Limnocylindrales bacterium]